MMSKFLKRLLLFVLLLSLMAAGVMFYRTNQSTKNVNHYRSEVAEIAAENGMEKYTDVILAIMYTESKGKGTDLMQSSESVYGVRGQISSQKESIEQGISHFAESLRLSREAGCDLSTAIQAYNYGFQYIDFVKAHGGTNSVELAEQYSRDVLSPQMGNNEQNQYRYVKWQAVLYNGGYLYQDGGNMFYADVVSMNQHLLDWFQRIQ
ncbi:hypothetical protein NRIC_06650 [Enterococcus florum]|uniref:CwlT-like lysozyme domain-containing protein n=1 Tax=Enterococcus florum TaxID=2480627 RepID=A0A4P5P902_9ENTE|nr:lysozyme family protein [Enterococcus florum]GCF92774.1 hypothetical protein NRIC_06650 [Enterococcus florum]